MVRQTEDNRWAFGAIALGIAIPSSMAVWVAGRSWNVWLTALVIIGVVLVALARSRVAATYNDRTLGTWQMIDVAARRPDPEAASAALVRGMSAAAGALHDAAGRAERLSIPAAVDLEPASFNWDS